MKHADDDIRHVAVKILKEDATRETKDDFRREVEIMSSFQHENILKLVGVVAISKYTTQLKHVTLSRNLSMLFP